MRERGPFKLGYYVRGLAYLAASGILLGSLAFLGRSNGQDTGSASSLAIPAGTTVRFAHIGDYGSGSSNENRVANLVKGWNPDFMVTDGDNNYPSGAASTIDQNIGQFYQSYIGNYKGSYGPGSTTNRFWPALGNHDWSTSGYQPYLDYFTLPNNERYYDVVFGGGLVELFVINSDMNEPDGNTSTSVQASWLQNALAASTACFKLVDFHHPPYTTGSVGSMTEMQWPFPSWGADMVLAGHAHVYERLDASGFPYIVNGLGGEDIATFGSTLPSGVNSVVRYNSDFGAMLVTANTSGITYQFYSAGDNLIDTYSEAKNCSGTGGSPVASLSPTSLAFPSQTVGTTSAAQVVNLSNPGSAALSLTSIAITGTNGADSAQTNNCPLSPLTLAANGTCTINVTFTPTATGIRSGILSIGDNATGSPQTVSLTGTGTSSTGGGSAAVLQVQNNIDTSGSAYTSFSVNITTNPGDLLVAFCRESSNGTDNFTVTDSAGQTWSQSSSGYENASSTGPRTGMFYVANSAAVTSVTVHYATSGGVIKPGIMVMEISGAESSGVADGSVNNASGASATTSASGGLSTSYPSDILIFATDAAANQTGWAAGAGYTIPNNKVAIGASGSSVRQAMEYAFVSSAQANATTSTSYANSAWSGNIFAAMKLASSSSTGGSPTVSFTGTPASAAYQSTFTVTATTDASTVATMTAFGPCSGSAVSGTAGSASATVTMTSGTGTCSLTANWAADNNYTSATASQSTGATRIAPSVTFTGAPASAAYRSTFAVISTTNASTAAVITSSGACTVAGNTVTMASGTGTCSLTASWASDGDYTSATASQSTGATKIAPTVTFTGAPVSAPYQSTFTVASTTNASTTAVITASGACTVAGNTVTITSTSGTCSLSASWATDSNYLAASATQSTAIGKATPTVTFTGAPASAAYQSTFTVTATTSASTLPAITASGPCSAGSVSGSSANASANVTMTAGTGTCGLTANWAADNNYTSATANQATTAVKSASATAIASDTPNPSTVLQVVTVSFSVTGNGSLTGTGTVNASTGESCNGPLSAGVGSCSLTYSAAGSRTLTATYGGDANFSGSTSAAVTQSVNGTASTVSAPAVVQVQNNIDASGTACTSFPVNITTKPGDLLVAFVRESSNGTDNFTVTDSAGQTWTLTASGYKNESSTGPRTGMFYLANSTAVTSVSVHYTTAGGVIKPGIMVMEISGAATSGVADGSVNNASGASTTSSSGSLTTTNANDILVFATDTSGNETGWTARAGYTIPNNVLATGASGSNVRMAMQYTVAAAALTNTTTTTSYANANWNGNIFAAFK